MLGFGGLMPLDRNRLWNTHLRGRTEVPARDTVAQGQALFQLSDDGLAMHYTLIVANNGSEALSVVDLELMQEVEQIPMAPVNVNANPIFPRQDQQPPVATARIRLPFRAATAVSASADFSASTNTTALFIYTDSRNGVGCPAVDAYQHGLDGTGPAVAKPTPGNVCPAQFGNSDVYVSKVTP